MRWIQHPITHKLIPADEYVRPSLHEIHDDIEPFVSPVDGSLIGSRSALREHNRRHGVVSQAEYGGTHNIEAQKKRERLFTGEKTREESLRRKQEIYETIMRAERN